MRIGNFTLRPSGKGKLWIERGGNDPKAGEGGNFPIAQLEDAIRRFYEDRF